MILISVILSGITSMHRHYYILPFNYCKNIFTLLFFSRGGGGDVAPCQISKRKISVRGSKPKKDFSHEDKNGKKPPPGEKGFPKD